MAVVRLGGRGGPGGAPPVPHIGGRGVRHRLTKQAARRGAGEPQRLAEARTYRAAGAVSAPVEAQADGFVGSRVHAARLPIARLAHIGQGAGIRALSSGRAAGPLHGSRELDPRGDVEFAEDVAQVRLDRLEAEEQLGGDLGVRLAVDD